MSRSPVNGESENSAGFQISSGIVCTLTVGVLTGKVFDYEFPDILLAQGGISLELSSFPSVQVVDDPHLVEKLS